MTAHEVEKIRGRLGEPPEQTLNGALSPLEAAREVDILSDRLRILEAHCEAQSEKLRWRIRQLERRRGHGINRE